MKRTDRFNLALVAMASCVVSGTAASAAERHRFVRVPAAAAEALTELGLQPVRELDYGAFRWLELRPSDHAALGRAGVAFEADDDAGTLAVGGVRFDPKADAEPGRRSTGTPS